MLTILHLVYAGPKLFLKANHGFDESQKAIF